MSFRIGWISPFTPASGVGTFSQGITRAFPRAFQGETIDLTILHPDHSRLYQSRHRCLTIESVESLQQILPLFDLLIYNIGNNREHHDAIFRMLRIHPGVIICHDYVYQHYLAEQSLRHGKNFTSYAALLTKYGDASTSNYLKKSRITSRTGNIRYSPWDSEYSVLQPMSDAILALGSALVVHSEFAARRAKEAFEGPVLKLGMPYDQKPSSPDDLPLWERTVASKRTLHAVSFGHIQATKCIDLVLAAMMGSKILRTKLRYTIAGFVGDESYLADLRRTVADNGLSESVTFEIGVSEGRLADLMRDADLFVNLRKPNTEGSSASLIEQLSAGRPVLLLDSGCYGEVDASAAIKLPPEASASEIRHALERLVGKPDLLPPIARAGQIYARRFSCASYAERLLGFIWDHRDRLRDRGHVVAVQKAGQPLAIDGDAAWVEMLARARVSMRYVDRNILALDPAIILAMSTEELCVYVAHVILGLFNKPELHRALMSLFTRRKGRAAYWVCVKLAVIADAVFDRQEAALARLGSMAASYDTDLWAIIEAFPPLAYMTAATLLLGSGYHALCEVDGDVDRLSLRRRVLDWTARLPPGEGLDGLRRWLEEPSAFDRDSALQAIDGDLTVQVGSVAFAEKAELSGFHELEPDHAWMKSNRGFVRLKLGPAITRVAFLVRQLHGTAEAPCVIALSQGSMTSEIEIGDLAPHWIALDCGAGMLATESFAWFQLSTSCADRPPNSSDTRVLGACLMRVRVSASPLAAADQNATMDRGASATHHARPVSA